MFEDHQDTQPSPQHSSAERQAIHRGTYTSVKDLNAKLRGSGMSRAPRNVSVVGR
jgi:hypothetical protein